MRVVSYYCEPAGVDLQGVNPRFHHTYIDEDSMRWVKGNLSLNFWRIKVRSGFQNLHLNLNRNISHMFWNLKSINCHFLHVSASR